MKSIILSYAIASMYLVACTSTESCPPGPACLKKTEQNSLPSTAPSKEAALSNESGAAQSDSKATSVPKEQMKDELLDRLGLTGPVAGLIDKGKELRDLRLVTLDEKSDGQESELATMRKVHDLVNSTIAKGQEEIGRVQNSLKKSLGSLRSAQETEKKTVRDELTRLESELSRGIAALPPDIAPKMQGILKELSAEYTKLESESPDTQESLLKNIDDLTTSLRGETYQIQGDQNKSISDSIDKMATLTDRFRGFSSGNLKRIEELSSQVEKSQAELSQSEEKARSGTDDDKYRVEALKASLSEARSEFFRQIALMDESKKVQAELIESLEQMTLVLKDNVSISQQSLAGTQKAKDDLNSRIGKSLSALDSKIRDLADDLGRRGDGLDADGLRLIHDSLMGTTAEMEGLRNQMSTMQNGYFDTAKKILDNQHEMTLLIQGLSPDKRDTSASVVMQTTLTEINALVQTNKQNVATLIQRLDQQLAVFEKKAEEVGASIKDARVVLESKAPCAAGPKKRYGTTVTQELTCGDKTVNLIVK